jgi:Zn ribbon nucleic-acid-binding protein
VVETVPSVRCGLEQEVFRMVDASPAGARHYNGRMVCIAADTIQFMAVSNIPAGYCAAPAHTDRAADADSNSYGGADLYANIDRDGDTDLYSHRDTDADANTDCYTNGN